MSDRRAGLLAASIIAHRDLRDAVRVLNAASIVPMPTKGALLQHIVYRDPSERMISDVDVLLPRGRFDEAAAALARAGYVFFPETRTAMRAIGPHGRLEIDLHRRPFPRHLFALSAEVIFSRARVDEALFGARVAVPTPLDLYGMLVGNFTKGRHTARDSAQARDFAAVAERFELDPAAIAAHLEAHGFAADPAHARAVLRELRRDRIGEPAARLARALSRRFGSTSRATVLAPHLVNRSLGAGARSLASHLYQGVRERVTSSREERARPAAR